RHGRAEGLRRPDGRRRHRRGRHQVSAGDQLQGPGRPPHCDRRRVVPARADSTIGRFLRNLAAWIGFNRSWRFSFGRSLMGMRKRLIALAVLAAVAATPNLAPAAQPAPAPEPTKSVDPHRYIGRWYEIARLPNMLQRDCTGPTSDWTPKDAADFAVVQQCRNGAGSMQTWRASGHIIDGSNNTKIRVG